MPSPLIRRLRIGDAVRDLRQAAGMSADLLGKRSGVARLDITRLENGSRLPNPDKLRELLVALDVPDDEPQHQQLIAMCAEAAARGWWSDAQWSGMGERQRVYADIESGAATIRVYGNGVLPGLLQTEAYNTARDRALRHDGEAIHWLMAAGRRRRQEELYRAGGPAMTFLLEEMVIRRLLVPPKVMVEQLQHLLDIGDRICIRIVPLDAPFVGVPSPRAPFGLYTFDDPADGTALMVEMVPDDILVRDSDTVATYVRLYDRLRDAALSEAESAAYIKDHAATLAA